MSVLFNLPDDCINSIFSDWLDLKDWRHVDQSCCLNRKLTDIMTQLLRNLTYPWNLYFYQQSKSLVWMERRKVKMKCIHISNTTRKLPDCNWSGVTHLCLSAGWLKDNIINLCPNLTSLHISATFVSLKKVEPAILSNLTDLAYQNPFRDWTSMEPVVLCCHKLRCFVLSSYYHIGSCPFVTQILTNNPHLTGLGLIHCCIDDATMTTIVLLCKELTELNLKCADDVDITKLIDLYSQLSKLEELTIHGKFTVSASRGVRCDSLDIATFLPLVRHVCANGVRFLILEQVYEISCSFLHMFLDFSKESLIYCTMIRCTFETEDEIQQLLSTCPNLKPECIVVVSR